MLSGLAQRRGLGVWSEMLSDGVLALDVAGALDPSIVLTTSVLYGSHELYTWVDHNPRLQVCAPRRQSTPFGLPATVP
jgi:acyl-CoA hydrolase